jgi:hypothetical protein
MSTRGRRRDDAQVRDADIQVSLGAEGDVTVTLDRTHTLLAAVRDAHRRPPPPPSEDDPRHDVFERELRILLRMSRLDSHYTEEDLLLRRDDILDRVNSGDDLEPLFDEMINSVLTTRTVDACLDTRFQIRLLAAVLSVYRPDIYTSGALEIGQHFYGRAERRLVAEGAISDLELQKAL